MLFLCAMACGEEGPDISTIPEPIIVEFSSSLNFIGGSLVDGKVDDTKLDFWVGTFEELTGDEPGTVTFTTSNIGFDAPEVDCEALQTAVSCPFTTSVNIARGIGLFARVEDPRGSEGNWLTTLSPLVFEDTMNRIRDNPMPFTSDLAGGTVLPRAFLELAATSLERQVEDLERGGALVKFIVDLDENGALVPLEGVVATLQSRRDYQVVYANALGLPDPTLDATSSIGAVWFFPQAPEATIHALFPIYTSDDGRQTVGQGFINHSAVSVFPHIFGPDNTAVIEQ